MRCALDISVASVRGSIEVADSAGLNVGMPGKCFSAGAALLSPEHYQR
jgi:hypothetical protein